MSKVREKKIKRTLVVTVKFPLNKEEISFIERNNEAGYPLEENLVNELVKVKSGLYENFLCGWVVSVKYK